MSFGKVPLRRVECRLRTHVVAAALHRLHAVVEDDTAQRVYLMLELMSGRSLASARLVYSEAAAKRLMYQLLTALAFVHDHDIVHRDVKPSNCLLSKDETLLKLAYVCGCPRLSAALCHLRLNGRCWYRDFGSAAFLSDGDDVLSSTVGTPAFFAPEVWRHHGRRVVFGVEQQAGKFVAPSLTPKMAPGVLGVNLGTMSMDEDSDDGVDYVDDDAPDAVDACYLGGFAGKPADVWAAGVTMFMLVTGRHPFWQPGEQTVEELQQAVARAQYVAPCA